jgi:hypothetical protein
VAAALAPDATGWARALAAASGSLGSGLAQSLAVGAGTPPLAVAALGMALALGAAALGSWLVAEPS